MPIPAQLWVSVKFKELPTLVRTKKDGWRVYSVDCGDERIVTFELRPRMFMKIEAGAAAYERWSAVVSGKMGARHGAGFHINEADVVAVMENKKPPKTAPAETPVTSAPVVEGATPESASLPSPVAEQVVSVAERLPSTAVAEPPAPNPSEVPSKKKAKALKPLKEPRGPEVYRVVRGASAPEDAASEGLAGVSERNDIDR